ncbi:hypothetical protein B0H17DRAFT_1078174 [Mycena rosella]|uniref:Uncharacterized protein n=1 Tax=Mycena rosella TaxID=1033263 RepID=A0AAD7GBD0_MYCRO|nr:hypothetical protein B0H17DRAFT_1078174 [Mycena rosella]
MCAPFTIHACRSVRNLLLSSVHILTIHIAVSIPYSCALRCGWGNTPRRRTERNGARIQALRTMRRHMHFRRWPPVGTRARVLAACNTLLIRAAGQQRCPSPRAHNRECARPVHGRAQVLPLALGVARLRATCLLDGEASGTQIERAREPPPPYCCVDPCFLAHFHKYSRAV